MAFNQATSRSSLPVRHRWENTLNSVGEPRAVNDTPTSWIIIGLLLALNYSDEIPESIKRTLGLYVIYILISCMHIHYYDKPIQKHNLQLIHIRQSVILIHGTRRTAEYYRWNRSTEFIMFRLDCNQRWSWCWMWKRGSAVKRKTNYQLVKWNENEIGETANKWDTGRWHAKSYTWKIQQHTLDNNAYALNLYEKLIKIII